MLFKRRDARRGDAGRSTLLWWRTFPLAIMLLATTAPGAAPQQQDKEAELMSVQLEASMQSSVLSELRAAASSASEGTPAAVPDSPAKPRGVHTGIPDSSAIAGQVFQLQVPPGPANATCNVHVSNHGDGV